jgi:glycosyltransferase involved in cell wall biosynthesis
MKVLFVSSGRNGVVGAVVKNQGDSLKNSGVDINYFLIKPGLKGYVLGIPKIRKEFKRGKFDLIHAHYSYSAYSASLAGNFPLIVSLMGSDVFMSGIRRIIIKIFSKFLWSEVIVKSKQMSELLELHFAKVIPNGVDLTIFKPILKIDARNILGYPENKKLIIFVSSPDRSEKNFALAKKAINLFSDPEIELRCLYDISSSELNQWLNAADLLLLTSFYEGSPNIIKEAMACNCPIVSTDVGDVKNVIGDTDGCFISSFDPADVADKIKAALDFGRKTNGRERIKELGLDSETIANKIIQVYKEVLKN